MTQVTGTAPGATLADGGAPDRVALTVRYFAAAAAGAGCDEETLVVPAGATVGDVTAAVLAAHPGLEALLALCSVLADGRLLRDPAAPLGGATTVDVLPPFAGG